MEIHLTAEQQAFVQEGVRAGRYRTAEEAIREALTSWEEEERKRAEILAGLDESADDLAAGRFRNYSDETLATLAGELKAEGRTQLEAQRRPR